MPVALWLNILLPVVAAVVLNGLIYARGWNSKNDASKVELSTSLLRLPPGWAIATIWTIIFALLGYAHYLLFPSVASFAIVAFLAFALAYPFLTALQPCAKVLDMLSLLLAVLIALLTLPRNGRAFMAMTPLLAWATYVNLVNATSCQAWCSKS